jgi:putative transposase
LGFPQQICRIFSSTNAIENLNGTARDICRRVKRWRSGEMILRWTCAAMHEAEKNFRWVQGYKGLR